MSSRKTQKNTRDNRKQVVIDSHNDEKLLERSKDTLDLINGWISVADTKISTSCGIISVMVAIIVFVAENILSKIDRAKGAIEPWKSFFIIFIVISIIAFFFALFLHLSALSPSFFKGRKKSIKNRKCNIFYEDIKDYKDAEEYNGAFRKMTDNQYIDEMLWEIYNNSQICSEKMHRFKFGLWVSFVCIVCIIACSIFYYMMYHH